MLILARKKVFKQFYHTILTAQGLSDSIGDNSLEIGHTAQQSETADAGSKLAHMPLY